MGLRTKSGSHSRGNIQGRRLAASTSARNCPNRIPLNSQFVEEPLRRGWSLHFGGVFRFCTYTHLLHEHFSAHSACTITLAHFHACAHARMAQGHEKGVCCMHVVALHLAFSSLMSHPSLLFLHTHFDITFLSTFLPYSPVLKAQDMRNSARAVRSLAIWPSPPSTQFMCPRSST